MRILLLPLLFVLLVACTNNDPPPPAATPTSTSQPASPTAVATATTAPTQAPEPTAVSVVATAAPPAPPPPTQEPSCPQASPQEVAAGMQQLNAKLATASPIEQVAVRTALTQLDRNGDGLPDPMICRTTLQTALLVLSQPAPSLPRP